MVLVQRVGLEGVCWWFGWRAPLRPGHTPLAALRCSRPFRSAKGAWPIVPLLWIPDCAGMTVV